LRLSPHPLHALLSRAHARGRPFAALGRPEIARRPSVGVAALLVAIVLIPLSAMAVLGVSELAARDQSVRQATRLRDSLVRVDALIALREALHNEQTAGDIRLRAVQFGLKTQQASAFFGFSAYTQLFPARDATDRALAHLGEVDGASDGVPIDRRALGTLRAEIDNAVIGAATADNRYEALDSDAEESLQSLLGRLSSMIGRVPGGYSVWTTLKALHSVSDGLSAGDTEVSAMTELSLESGRGAMPTIAGLGHASVLYESAHDDFQELGLPGLTAAWAGLDAAPSASAFERAVVAAETGPMATESSFVRNPPAVASMLRGGFTRNDGLYALVGRTSAAVRAGTDAFVSRTTADYHNGLLLLVGLALLSIVLALAAAQFITRPLRRLAELAGAVSAGRLDVRPARSGGPKETVVIAEAFDDLVSNLRLLESKSQALASCDFTNPVLSEPLPGQLGRSIESSVQVLSGSIEARDKLQHRLAHQATHDALTGVHNRAAAVSALEQSLARAHRTGDAVGVLYIDLDDFKRANDHHGHHVGDQILKDVATRMLGVVRGGDMLARIGGDEFLVVAEGIRNVSEAAALAQRLIDAVAEPVDHEGLPFTVGACVGVAMALDPVDEPGHLLARADLALYRAKQRGRAKIEIYDERLQEELRRRDEIEQALAAALRAGGSGLVLHYQPVIDTSEGRVVTLEALIRWNRGGLPMLLPADFIPVAEASDLIIDLDVWVLRSVAEQIAEWQREPEFADVQVSVNISGRHLLSQKLSRHLEMVLDETGIDASRLIFEITETVLLSDLPTAAAELDRIRDRGVHVAIDDFGTGYTSIAHLQHLPIDSIKIDRSFVRSVEEARDRSLVRMVTDLSHNIGVSVVAEGVETPVQRDVLRGLGCDNLQGFLIRRPAPASEILPWMRARERNDQTQAPT
jgi:diguanylate cyclase (GGDEF)-like protein